MTDTIYQISGLCQRYTGSPVLDIEHLVIHRGRITGLLGPNGSGKTTLLRLLAFIDSPWQGEIRFCGRRTGPFSEPDRRQVAFLPQTPCLLKRSVMKNVAYGLAIRGLPAGQIGKKVDEALAMVGLSPEAFRHRRPGELSGGEAQRVALAARLAIQPHVLLLDEPTASVDAESARRIKQAAHTARTAWGTTVLVISHDLQWLYEGCDRILQFHQGRVWEAGDRNAVPGPWQAAENGSWAKELSDGQQIRVPPPPVPDATALLAFRTAFDTNKDSSAGSSPGCITGTVSRLILEKSTGQIAVSLAAGDLLLTIKASAEEIAAQQIYPGRAIAVAYDPADVSWLAKET